MRGPAAGGGGPRTCEATTTATTTTTTATTTTESPARPLRCRSPLVSLPAPAPRPGCRPRSHDASEPPDVYNVAIRALTRGWRASTRRRCTCPASTPARSTAARAAPSPTTAASCPPAPTGGSGRRSGLQSGMERSPTRGQGGTARHFQPRAVPVARRGNCSWPPH